MAETQTKPAEVISPEQLRKHWQGHRQLTRRVIAAFPEKDLFSFSIGGMRTGAELSMELIGIAAPGVRELATGEPADLKESFEHGNKKEALLAKWDDDSKAIDRYWPALSREKFAERVVAFGQYEGTVLSTLLYYIDNEIHHRGQMYVYLRALGIEPPMFWDRP